MDFSLQAKYTDRAAAARMQIICQLLGLEIYRVVSLKGLRGR
jgi:hypothetical protein